MSVFTERTLIKGMDLSTLAEVEECGGRFSYKGEAGDAMEILRRCGMNLVRLRLWNDPVSETGEPYGAGNNDLERTIALARRARALGVDWLLDFHYSDFWADPGKQITPKAWQGLDAAALEQAVFSYTRSVLLRLKEEDLLPAMTAVGNEITNGLLWPLGRAPNFENIARFVSAGIRAVNSVDPAQPVMLHLDNGTNGELYRGWFDAYFAAGGQDFDCVGMSYYPFWNGSIGELGRNMAEVSRRLGKDIIIAETSMGFTMDDYRDYEQLSPDQRKGMATRAELAAKVPYPMTPQGQCAFLTDLAEAIRRVPDGRGKGFIWWEPAWLPVPGSGWASGAALSYIGEKGPGGNEWANQTLFDYQGRALPALDTIEGLC